MHTGTQQRKMALPCSVYVKDSVNTVNARFYVYPSKKKSDILYLVTDNPRTIVYNYFYTS